MQTFRSEGISIRPNTPTTRQNLSATTPQNAAQSQNHLHYSPRPPHHPSTAPRPQVFSPLRGDSTAERATSPRRTHIARPPHTVQGDIYHPSHTDAGRLLSDTQPTSLCTVRPQRLERAEICVRTLKKHVISRDLVCAILVVAKLLRRLGSRETLWVT